MGTVFVTPIVFSPIKYNVSPIASTKMDEIPIIASVMRSIVKIEFQLPRKNNTKKA